MTIRFLLPAAFALCVCLCPPPVAAQGIEQATFSLQKAIGDLELASSAANRASSGPTTYAFRPAGATWLDSLLSSIQKNANAIQTASVSLPSDERQLYGRTLLFNADLLRAAALGRDAAVVKEMLTQVDADLRIKASATKGMGMASRFNGKVVVHVVTVRAGQTVPGFVIVLNPLAYRGSIPFIRFEKISSPTTGHAPPGRYRLITLQNGVQSSAEVVDIGLDAQDNVTLEVQVP